MDSSLINAIYAALAAFAVCVIVCPIAIPYLTRLKYGQSIREEGPQSHQTKAGTPVMGGLVILAGMTIAALVFGKGNKDILAVVLTTLGFGAIGFADDFVKVVKRRSLGLRAYQKILSQLAVAGMFITYLYSSGADLSVYIPFSNAFYIDFKWLTVPFLLFILLGFSNGVNLTDGLDGLASGVTAIVSIFLLFTSYTLKSPLTTVNAAAGGALMGFLLFNSHPAKVFMGDTGSLALGGFVATVAILLKMPIVLGIAGIVYFAESLSVILQVGYFKITKGKRIFRMAPLHHHFELGGMKETQVVSLFYVVTAVACLIAFLATQNL